MRGHLGLRNGTYDDLGAYGGHKPKYDDGARGDGLDDAGRDNYIITTMPKIILINNII